MIAPPIEQERLANNISRTKQHLLNLGVGSDEFKRRSDLAKALDLVLHNRTDEALQELENIIKSSVDDSFVNARALALKAYVTIVKGGRECTDPEVAESLKKALDKDTQIAIVYNAMGLCILREAGKMRNSQTLSNEGWKTYSENMRSAIYYFKIASEIKPTVQSKYRALNNEVWSNCKLFEAALKDGFPMKMFTDLTGYKDTQEFLTDSRKQLGLAQTLSPKNNLTKETRVELLCLEAESEKDEKNADLKWASVKQDYLELIDQDLFKTYKTCQEAIQALKEDSLLGKLRDDRDIIRAIESKYAPGSCH